MHLVVWQSLCYVVSGFSRCSNAILLLAEAVPKRILDLMNVEGLTRENVASHLQVLHQRHQLCLLIAKRKLERHTVCATSNRMV